MTVAGFASVAALLSRQIGLRLDTAMAARLARCLRDEATEQASTVEAVAEAIHRDPLAQQRLLNRVTVQESWFFRDTAQLEALAEHLPLRPGPVRIWVAGCANGQEAYTIAMVLAEAHRSDAQILATDVSTRALDRARSGRYYARELRGLSAQRRTRFLRPYGDEFVVTDELRARVTFSRQNLVTDPVPVAAGSATVVFCRNVLIYFRPEEVPGTVRRIAGTLPPGGLLFSGVAEAQWQVGGHFELIRVGDAFVYRRRDPSPVPSAPPGPSAALVPQPRPATRITRLPAPARSLPPEPAPPTPAEADVTAAALEALHAGELAAAAADHEAAVVHFRRAAYLDPALPMAHFQLGMVLEFRGDHRAAARAYAVAARTLAADDGSSLGLSAPGYSTDVLRRMLDLKLTTTRSSR